MFAVTRKGKTERSIRGLMKITNQIARDQEKITQAYHDLDQTSDKIRSAINAIEGQQLGPLNALIDARDLPEDYKANLKKELVSSKTEAINTLVPLRQTAEKLCANMVVSQDKAIKYMLVLEAQTHVLEAGKVQFETLKRLHTEGQELQNQIEELLVEVEEINKVSTVRSFKNNKQIGFQHLSSASLLEMNPLVKGLEDAQSRSKTG